MEAASACSPSSKFVFGRHAGTDGARSLEAAEWRMSCGRSGRCRAEPYIAADEVKAILRFLSQANSTTLLTAATLIA